MASSTHTIRLHGPWQCELFKSPNAASEMLTIKLPVDWGSFFLDQSCDSMIWRRSFGRPSNLGDQERVELVISDLHADVLVALNQSHIEPIVGSGANARFELTNRLELRNQLALKIHTPWPKPPTQHQPDILDEVLPAGPFGHVILEILTVSDQTQ